MPLKDVFGPSPIDVIFGGDRNIPITDHPGNHHIVIRPDGRMFRVQDRNSVPDEWARPRSNDHYYYRLDGLLSPMYWALERLSPEECEALTRRNCLWLG